VIDVRSKQSQSGGFVAWGKWGRIVTDCPVREPGNVWFDFGDTPEEAENKVRSEIEAAPRGHDGRPFFFPQDTLPGQQERLRDAVDAFGKALKAAFAPLRGLLR
jgi:hypothetical protein